MGSMDYFIYKRNTFLSHDCLWKWIQVSILIFMFVAFNYGILPEYVWVLMCVCGCWAFSLLYWWDSSLPIVYYQYSCQLFHRSFTSLFSGTVVFCISLFVCFYICIHDVYSHNCCKEGLPFRSGCLANLTPK